LPTNSASSAALPPPSAVRGLLVWHQGALGDLLLAGPAFQALRRRYSRSRLAAVGHPGRWALYAPTLGLDEIYDGGDALWGALYTGDGPLPPALAERLAGVDLALIFTPREDPAFLARMGESDRRAALWAPSFPETGSESVAALQARRLALLGLPYVPAPLRLTLDAAAQAEARALLAGDGPWLAVAPGSGNPLKNWPLSHYFEVSRALAWEFKLSVVWCAGPAEHAWLPYLAGLAAAQGHVLAAGFPLPILAALLSRCRLYLGGDSGLTHLAAAAGAGRVLALFGPTSPAVWAPLGDRVTVLQAPCELAPCAMGRQITCDRARCLEALPAETVYEAARTLLKRG